MVTEEQTVIGKWASFRLGQAGKVPEGQNQARYFNWQTCARDFQKKIIIKKGSFSLPLLDGLVESQ